MMGEDEQRSAIGAAEDDVDGPLGYVDAANLPARRTVNEDLPVGDVYVASAIDCHAFSAAIGKDSQIAQRAVSAGQRAVGAVFRLAGDIDTLAGNGAEEAGGIEIVGEAPAAIVRRALLKHAKRGEKG